MGAIFRLPAIEARMDDILQEIKSREFSLVGANARAAAAYDDVDWTGPLALLFGGEGSGIPPQAEDALDVRVAIPMAAGVESLSVNAAAAVLLFEAARKRRPISRA
jgi:tRNA G18 (ribose-2'-O)-methylase SpoU